LVNPQQVNPLMPFTLNGPDNGGYRDGLPTGIKTGFNRHLRGALRRPLPVRTSTNSGSLRLRGGLLSPSPTVKYRYPYYHI